MYTVYNYTLRSFIQQIYKDKNFKTTTLEIFQSPNTQLWCNQKILD